LSIADPRTIMIPKPTTSARHPGSAQEPPKGETMHTRSTWRRRIGSVAVGTLLFGSVVGISPAAANHSGDITWTVPTADQTVGVPFDATVVVQQRDSTDIKCVKLSVSAGTAEVNLRSSTPSWSVSPLSGTEITASSATAIGAKPASLTIVIGVVASVAAPVELKAVIYSNETCTVGVHGSTAGASQDTKVSDAITIVAAGGGGFVPALCADSTLWLMRTATLSNATDGCLVESLSSVRADQGPITFTRKISKTGNAGPFVIYLTPDDASNACMSITAPAATRDPATGTWTTTASYLTDGTVDVTVSIPASCGTEAAGPELVSFVMGLIGSPAKKERFFVNLDVTAAPNDGDDGDDGDERHGGGGGGGGGGGAMSMSCSPEPQVNVTVTCTIVNGPTDFDIIWEASYNPVFATGVVTLDGSGNGSFSFLVPAAAMGSMVGVQLVAHTGVMPIGMVTTAVPVIIRAGEGSSPLAPMSLLLMVGGLLTVVGVGRRLVTQG
jgi:hypothetical protein